MESWLCPDISEHEIYIPGYQLFRLDRNRHGGGVLLYARDCLTAELLPCHHIHNLEFLPIVIHHPSSNSKFCISVFYRPPNSPVSIFDTLFCTLASLNIPSFSHFVLVGDFNVNMENQSHQLYYKVHNLFDYFNLTQVVSEFTHTDHCGSTSLIDLVFTSTPSQVLGCTTIPPLDNPNAKSYHLGILLTISWKSPVPQRNHPLKRRVWRYNHADFDRANELLCDLDLNDIFDHTNIQTSWLQFKCAFLDVMAQCIPRSVVTTRKNLPWLSKSIIQLIRKRDRYFKKASRYGNQDDRLKFKQLRNKVVYELRHAKQSFFSNLHPKNPREFWKVVRSLNASDSTVPPLSNGHTTASSNSDKANLLNSTFSSHFNRSVPELSSFDLPVTDPDTCPSDILCTEEEVYELLCSLDTSTSNGDDGISATMLKATVQSITPVVTKIFNISLKLGEIPYEWKTARITPIPKFAIRNKAGNYRPISLLSVLSKLLEKHVRNLLLNHLKDSHPLSIQQWGFSPGKSTTGTLLYTTNDWHDLLDSGTDVCAVFFDFRKAFDTVPHRPLLHKLHDLSVQPHVLKWLTCYLSSRSQYVCVRGSSSDLLPVTSGVPQGSVLGPLLFIIYIDSITTVPLSAGSLSLYADDMLLYRPITSMTDFDLLQKDINNLSAWSANNYLNFDASKCKFMIISRRSHPTLPISPLLIRDCPLERVYSYKYLGVWLTSTLSWSVHISKVCARARRQVGILYRKFYGHANSPTLFKLYLSFVRPLLEYAAPVWDPHHKGLIDSLESVQKFGLKVVTGAWDSDYVTLLSSCNISSLQSRRRQLKMLFLYKIIHGETFPNPPIQARNIARYLRSNGQHHFVRPPTHSNAHYFSFFPHSITLWNSLPNSVLCLSIYHK